MTHQLSCVDTTIAFLHARDQHHFKDVLGAGRRVSHGNVESSVDAESHLPQVALRLLAVAIIWHVDVREHAMEVETGLLACNETENIKSIEHRDTILSHLELMLIFVLLINCFSI